MNIKWNSPVLMIGIDAATWDVIDPLLNAGRLPNIARLMQDGTYGRLKSLPFLSPALWTSIITGKFPEKHGVLDFYSSTRHNIRAMTLYEILAGESGRIGLFRWYATWPPMQNNGFTVPSPLARSPETYPVNLQFLNDLLRPAGYRSYVNGGIQLLRHRARPSTLFSAMAELAYEALFKPEHLDWWYRRRLVETAIYTDVFADLLRKYHPEFAAILFSHTDDLSHRYWRYREPEAFTDVKPAEIKKYGQVIDKAYIAADAAIGLILKAVPEDALVIVLSDHGQEAGPAQETPYRMSKTLLTRLGFADRVWMTYIGYSTFIRSRAATNGAKTLEDLRGLLQQVRTEPDGTTIFQVSRSDEFQLSVDVDVKTDADLHQRVFLPGGQRPRLGEIIFTDGRLSGIHSEWGILIMKGPGVRKGCRIADATLLDVAPTVLALRDMPVAKDMDGQVIEEAIEAGFLKQNPIGFIETYGSLDKEDKDPSLTQEEIESLESRLKKLGYL